MVAVTAHIPWLLYLADVLMTAPEPRRRAVAFAGVGLTLGSALLLGFPQGVWVNGVALGWLLVYRVVNRSTLSRAALVCGAAAAGVLIGAVQLLPTLDALRSSFRAATTLDFRVTFSLHPFNLVQLFSPVHLHPADLCTGTGRVVHPRVRGLQRRDLHVEPVLDSGALERGCTPKACGVAIWTGGACACPGARPLRRALPDACPGARPFEPARARSPHRPAALRARRARGHRTGGCVRTRRRRAECGRPTPVAARHPSRARCRHRDCRRRGERISLGGFDGSASEGRSHRHWRRLPVSPGSGPYSPRAQCAVRWAAPLLIVLTAIDLAAWGTRYAYSKPLAKISSIAPATGFPPGRNGDLVHPQVVLTDMNKLPLRGYRSSTAYLGLTRSSALDPDTAVAQRIAGVQWYWTPAGWLPREDTLPRARLVAEQQVSTDPATDLAGIDPVQGCAGRRSVRSLSQGGRGPQRSRATIPEAF